MKIFFRTGVRFMIELW